MWANCGRCVALFCCISILICDIGNGSGVRCWFIVVCLVVVLVFVGVLVCCIGLLGRGVSRCASWCVSCEVVKV